MLTPPPTPPGPLLPQDFYRSRPAGAIILADEERLKLLRLGPQGLLQSHRKRYYTNPFMTCQRPGGANLFLICGKELNPHPFTSGKSCGYRQDPRIRPLESHLEDEIPSQVVVQIQLVKRELVVMDLQFPEFHPIPGEAPYLGQCLKSGNPSRGESQVRSGRLPQERGRLVMPPLLGYHGFDKGRGVEEADHPLLAFLGEFLAGGALEAPVNPDGIDGARIQAGRELAGSSQIAS
jgi:hypothetical protein